MPLPPGPPGPAALTSLRFARRPLDRLSEWRSRYGDLFTVRFTGGFGEGVYVADPEAIEGLFSGDQSDLLAGEANGFLKPILGPRSVLVLDGPEHLRQRRALLPPFGAERIARFREVTREVAIAEVERWRVGDRVTIRRQMRDITFEVICRAVFGVEQRERIERMREALSSLIGMAPTLLLPGIARANLGPLSPGGLLARRLMAADALLYEEIARRRREPNLSDRDDVLSLLLAASDRDGESLGDAEIRDELITLLLAGHETSATGLAFAFELLMRNPDELARLREAIEGPDADAQLEAVVRESLRLRPVIDAAERTLAGPRSVGGWDLPAGTKVYPAIYLVHQREDLYPDAAAFRPGRFLDGKTRSYSWLPFGGGIRRCIGAGFAQAEMAEVLREVLPRVELRPVRREPDPIVLRGITIAPKHGVEAEVVGLRN